MDIRSVMAERQAAERARQEQLDRLYAESRELVRSFAREMTGHKVGTLAVYRAVEHKITETRGFFHREEVDTGKRYYTHDYLGEGWRTQINDGHDWTPKSLTVMENGEDSYWTTGPQTNRHDDIPEAEYLIAHGDSHGNEFAVTESYQATLGYTAMALIEEANKARG